MRINARNASVAAGAFALGIGLAGAVARETGPAPPAAHAAIPQRSVKSASELSAAFVAIAEAVTPAVVRIQAEHTAPAARQRVPFHDFFDPQDGDVPQVAGGSGFLVSSDGYILTNNHVVEDADRITVTLVDKRSFSARIVGRDPTTDVAVVKIDATGLPVAKLGDSDQARVGEWVLAIGNPGFGGGSTLDFTVTEGIISAKGRPLQILAQEMGYRNPASNYAIEDFIQTDAVINPGNSGGPLVNLAGEVIGINSAIASSTGYNEGYGFAIPSNLARRVMTDLIDGGRVRRPLLGVTITDVSAEDAEVYRLPSIAGVLIEDFAEASPAARAGLQRGDVIVEVDGQPVERLGQLQRMVAQHRPGDVVDVGVIRYGEREDFQVRLMEAAIPVAQVANRVPPPRAPEGLGLEVAELTPEMARRAGFTQTRGAVISKVAPFGPAGRKQLDAGDRILSINGKPITSARQAQEMLRSTRSGDVVSILVERSGGRTHIANIRAP
ncbi:MAG: Do family serine endopeptidase [Gemmatimonadetes bacterium]|nr:Do family serine endopeptidase [Gemmatimonadota bacterium]